MRFACIHAFDRAIPVGAGRTARGTLRFRCPLCVQEFELFPDGTEYVGQNVTNVRHMRLHDGVVDRSATLMPHDTETLTTATMQNGGE